MNRRTPRRGLATIAQRRPRWQTVALAFAVAPACGPSLASPPAPSCPADRVIVLASHADIARLASCTVARGVTLRSGAALDASKLHALTTITGDLVIGPTVAIDDVTLRELRVVGGAIHVAGNGLLQGLYLPKLERAGRIEIEGNASITTISLPQLQTVHGALHITDNANLALVDLSALTTIDQDLVLTGDPNLNLLEATQLQHAAAVRLDAPALPSDVADHLRAIAAPH
jgi:hypothetical protein